MIGELHLCRSKDKVLPEHACIANMVQAQSLPPGKKRRMKTKVVNESFDRVGGKLIVADGKKPIFSEVALLKHSCHVLSWWPITHTSMNSWQEMHKVELRHIWLRELTLLFIYHLGACFCFCPAQSALSLSLSLSLCLDRWQSSVRPSTLTHMGTASSELLPSTCVEA